MIFVPHYLSIFWAPLRTNPWDIVIGIVLTWALVGINVIGIKEAAGLNVFLAVLDFATQLLAGRARVLPDLQPACALAQRAPGHRADLERVPARDPGRDDRLHRHRDGLQPRRGGARPRPLDPTRDLVGRDRRLRDLLHAAVHRPVGDARGARGAPLRHAAGPEPAARLQERSRARARREPRPARLPALGGQGLRRDPRRDDPLHRHERRRDRRVAHHLFDGEPSPAPGGVPAPAPEAEDAAGWRCSSSARSARRSSSCRARSTSSGGCTRSGRCCRSRSRTWP